MALLSKPFTFNRATQSHLARRINQKPFLMFGLPFLTTVLAGSFILSYFTQIKFDRRDQQVRTVSKEDQLGLSKDRRKVDIREEYHVSASNCIQS